MSDSLQTEPSLDLGRLRQAIQEEYTAWHKIRSRLSLPHGPSTRQHARLPDDWLEGLPKARSRRSPARATPFASANSSS